VTEVERETLLAAAAIHARIEAEAWAEVKRTQHENKCECGESYEHIEARSRWSDISMARHFFERVSRGEL